MIALLVLLAVGMAKASSPVAEGVANPHALNDALVDKPQATLLSEPRPSADSGGSGDMAQAQAQATELPINTSARPLAVDTQRQPN